MPTSSPPLPETTPAILRPGAPLNALTGVRFVAAFGVVLCHFATVLFPWGPEGVIHVAQGMFNMVGLFFMLSGFVLAHSYGARFLDGTASTGSFLRARLARIYPTYLFSLLLALPIFWVTQAERSARTVAEHAAVKLPLLQTWVFWNPEYSEAWNGPTWSISTELFFYLAFPVLAMPLLRLRGRAALILLGLISGAMIGLALWYDLVLNPGYAGRAPAWIHGLIFNSPFVRIGDFAIGILLYPLTVRIAAVGKEPSAWTRHGLWALIGAGSVLLWGSALYMAKSQGLTIFLFAPMLALLAFGKGRVARFLALSSVVRLGEESYALYLVHIPISEWFAARLSTIPRIRAG